MKKKCRYLYLWATKMYRLSLVFQLAVFLLLFSGQFASAMSDGPLITLNLKRVLIKDVIWAIEKQSKLVFVYNAADLDKEGRVDVEVKNKSVREVLDVCLKGTGLGYFFQKDVIVIKRKERDSSDSPGLTITGKVTDKDGVPLPGVTVSVKGLTVGTASSSDGKFVIAMPVRDSSVSLVFSFVGMKSKTLKAIFDMPMVVVLEEDSQEMEEVVVNGYQSINRKDMVGSYTTLKASDIMMPAYTSIDQMLQGRVAGMIVTNTSSRVGTSPKIQIRGATTILGNQDPLWVVDGIIQPDPIAIDANRVMTDDLENILGNQISWLNPADIESVTVLKDASATAIYGAKASNGVIVITTKRGIKDRMSVNYSVNFSFRARPTYADFNLMNSKERVRFSREAYESGARYKDIPVGQVYTYEGLMQLYNDKYITEQELKKEVARLETGNTNWLKILTRNSFSHSHNLSITGGSQKISYSASLAFSDNKGIEVGNDSRRMSGRVRVGADLHPKFRFDINISGQIGKTTGYGPGVNPLQYATTTSRAIRAYEDDGSKSFYNILGRYGLHNRSRNFGYNILNELENSYSQSKNSGVRASLDLSWNVLPWLKYQFVGGLGSTNSDSESFAGEKTLYITTSYRGYDYASVAPDSDEYKSAELPFGGEFFSASGAVVNYNIQNKLLISKSFAGEHRLNVMLGTEVRSTNTRRVSNTVWGYIPERGEQIIIPTRPSELIPMGNYTVGKDWGIFEDLYSGGWKKHSQEDNYFSLFATLAYSLKDCYVFNFNIRSDVSNRFGQNVNKRFDPTYSFGVSWRVAEESFLKDHTDWLEQFNLRATYGIQGNVVTSLSPDLIAKIGSVLPVYNQYYSKIARLPNPFLKWERTKTWNLGLDIQFLKAFVVNLEYYGRSSNAIVNQSIPQEYGKYEMELDGGHLANHGVELSMNLTPVNKGDYAWTIRFNYSKNWNKASGKELERTKNSLDYITGASDQVLKKGYPLTAFWSYSFKGLNPETGYPEFNKLDVEVDRGIDPTEFLVYSGQKDPSFTGGLSTLFRFKGASLGADFNLLLGKKKRLPSPFTDERYMPSPYSNVDKRLLDRWKRKGDETRTNIPALYTGGEYAIDLPDGGREDMYRMWAQSDEQVVDASFLRCSQLYLAWDVDREWIRRYGLKNLSLSFTVNNVFVVASRRFNGFDPELSDNSVMPRTFSFGIRVGL